MEIICRIHVLKRFSAFEWALFILVVSYVLIDDNNFYSKYNISIIIIPTLLMAFLSSISFDAAKFVDFDNHHVGELRARRYFDIMLYIILMSLCGIYGFFWSVFPLIVISLMSDYHWLAGILSFIILILLPAIAAIFLSYDQTQKPWKFFLFIFKLVDIYNFMTERIENLHCLKIKKRNL